MSLKRFFTMSSKYKHIIQFDKYFHYVNYFSANKIYMEIGEKIISRAFVPEDKISWDVNWPEYKPISFSLDFKSKPWADPDIRLLITTTKNLFTFFIHLVILILIQSGIKLMGKLIGKVIKENIKL